jgi:hypothetical protein
MTTRREWHFMAAAALAASVLAGCASPALHEAAQSETPSPTATETPTPTPASESTMPASAVPGPVSGPLIASSRPGDVQIIQLVDQTGTVAYQGLNNADEVVFFTGRCAGTGELDVKISGLGWFGVDCGPDAPEMSQGFGASHVQAFDLTITPPDASTVWAVTLTSGSLD